LRAFRRSFFPSRAERLDVCAVFIDGSSEKRKLLCGPQGRSETSARSARAQLCCPLITAMPKRPRRRGRKWRSRQNSRNTLG
jgi:hypothetical protein